MLANSRLLAGDTRIPVVLSFKNGDGSVTRDTDARQQTINYTLTYANDATATPGCAISGSLPVPLGPYVYGVVQDQPATGTTAWPFPGDQGTNAMNVVVVPGGRTSRSSRTSTPRPAPPSPPRSSTTTSTPRAR